MEDTIKEGDIIIVDKVFVKIILINRGDVIVFKNFINNYFVKRCIGKAGDLVRIVNGEVFINEQLEKTQDGIKMNYQIETKNNVRFYETLDSLAIKSDIYPANNNKYEGILNSRDKMKLKNTLKVTSINRIYSSKNEDELYFNNRQQSWTSDSTGYIRVPKKGMKLSLNENTYDYYIKTIKQFEGVDIKRKDNQYFLEGVRVKNYTFNNNYVFLNNV